MKKHWLKFVIGAVLVGAVVWAGKGIFKYSIFATHDLKHHMVRSFDAILTIKECHFPLRWAGIMNYECGVPIYNFYYPLLYYLVIVINFFVGGVILPLKIINFLSLLVGTAFFYLWMKEEVTDRWASLGGAMLYLFAPYRFLLIYVRGSPEYLAYAVLPVVLYFFARSFRFKTGVKFYFSLLGAAFSGGLLVISHNIVSVFVMPIILLYLIINIFQEKKKTFQRIFTIIFSYVSAFGLGAFFIFPALIEERFTKISIPVFNYYHHFPTLWQVIRSPWGYGDSAIGSEIDAMSFQLGYAHWAVIALVSVWLIFMFSKAAFGKKIKEAVGKNIWILVFFVLSTLFLFLVLPWSLPVWNNFLFLQTIQFPWRLLGVCVFTISALFTFWLTRIKPGWVYWLLLIGITSLSIIGNRNHLLPQPVLENDLPLYQTIDNLNYSKRLLPAVLDTVLAPGSGQPCSTTTPVAVSNSPQDKLSFKEVKRGSTYGEIMLTSNRKRLEGDKIILNLSYFPGMYHFQVNGGESNYQNCSGRVCLKADSLADGLNTISWKVGQTGVQRFFNGVTLLFLGIWGCVISKEKLNEK